MLLRRVVRVGAICLALAAATAGAQPGPYGPQLPAGSQAGVSGPQPPGAAGIISRTPAAAALGAALGVPEAAQPPPLWTASVVLQETLTNNANLAPSDTRTSALITEITPILGLNYVGPRASLIGNASLPMMIYLPRSAASDRVYPAVNLIGNVIVVENFFFLEGVVNVAQQFFSPFGPQPVSTSNPTNNRYRADTYRISPFIRSTTARGTEYELRNDNVWSNLSGAPIQTNNSRYTSFSGNATNTQSTLGWGASFNYTDVHFSNDQPSTITQLYRASAIYTVTPSLQVSASAGWEENQFQFTSSSDVIYGVGFVWRPTPVTSMTGDWENRYFGSSYRFLFEHTTPLSEWRLRASRDVTTYPEQIASLPGGVNVSSFLNALFSASITDPIQRQQLIDQLVRDRGLPTTLSGPVSLYSNQTILQQSVVATVGLIGARNTIFVSGYYVKSEPITATGTPLPPILSLGNDNTQTGGTVVWTHSLTPRVNFVSSLDGSRTVGNGGLQADTKQGAVRLGVSSPITAQTTVYAGARYQTLLSNAALPYTEVAGFVGLTYTFR